MGSKSELPIFNNGLIHMRYKGEWNRTGLIRSTIASVVLLSIIIIFSYYPEKNIRNLSIIICMTIILISFSVSIFSRYHISMTTESIKFTKYFGLIIGNHNMGEKITIYPNVDIKDIQNIRKFRNELFQMYGKTKSFYYGYEEQKNLLCIHNEDEYIWISIDKKDKNDFIKFLQGQRRISMDDRLLNDENIIRIIKK